MYQQKNYGGDVSSGRKKEVSFFYRYNETQKQIGLISPQNFDRS